jgi:hypothetical protein
MVVRPLLACALILPLLAACGSASSPAGDVFGAHGPTVDHVRGAAPDSGVLRPEPGNIWSEGLTPSQTVPNR